MSDKAINTTKKSLAPDPSRATTPKDLHKPATTAPEEGMSITITENGPYIVRGNVPLSEDAICNSKDGSHLEYHKVRDYDSQETYALCRCGQSKHKPFCDGTHEHIDFNGKETADRRPYLKRADMYPGPELDLLDDNRCAFARLCHRNGSDVWTLTEEAETENMEREAVGGSWNCPTGRLEHHNDATGKVYEQDLEPGIIALEDLEEGVSAPLFVHGGIPLISADGSQYELRNRYALCRCGYSSNKPFCDAMHVNAGFYDDSPSFEEGWSGIRDDTFKDMPDKI